MNSERLLATMEYHPDEPGYGVVVLLYSYYIPVKRHAAQVIEAFWSDDTYHFVAFHSSQEAWDYIELAKQGKASEYLPSETFARYREWEKKQYE